MNPTAEVNKSGQSIRQRGQEKRRALVDATRSLLKEKTLTSLTTADIARAAGTSKPNFYLYFSGVNDAVLAAVEDVSMETPEILEVLHEEWTAENIQRGTETFVALYLRHWHAHAHILRARTLMVTEGDPRFIGAEITASARILHALTHKIAAHNKEGDSADAVHPQSAAAAILAMLERLAAYGPQGPNPLGVTGERLVHACAKTLRLILTAA